MCIKNVDCSKIRDINCNLLTDPTFLSNIFDILCIWFQSKTICFGDRVFGKNLLEKKKRNILVIIIIIIIKRIKERIKKKDKNLLQSLLHFQFLHSLLCHTD